MIDFQMNPLRIFHYEEDASTMLVFLFWVHLIAPISRSTAV